MAGSAGLLCRCCCGSVGLPCLACGELAFVFLFNPAGPAAATTAQCSCLAPPLTAGRSAPFVGCHRHWGWAVPAVQLVLYRTPEAWAGWCCAGRGGAAGHGDDTVGRVHCATQHQVPVGWRFRLGVFRPARLTDALLASGCGRGARLYPSQNGW